MLLLAALTLIACNTKAPTTSSATSPTITSVTPQTLFASGAPQMLTIRGERFLTGLELNVATPGGGTFAVLGSAIQSLQTSSFQAPVVLPTPGTYTLTVRNSNGDQSPPFALPVLGAAFETAPFITTITPSSLIRGPQLQEITVQGANFVAGLTVQITEPDGAFGSQSGNVVSGLTASQFQLTIAFTKVGTYSLRVVNPSGESSNSVILFVAQ